MRVVLGTYNKVNKNGRKYLVGSKGNFESMIEEAMKRQGGRLYVEPNTPTILKDEHPADFQLRQRIVDVLSCTGHITDIKIEESEQTNSKIKNPILTATGSFEAREQYEELITSDTEFCIRAFADKNKIVRIVTWDLCITGKDK